MYTMNDRYGDLDLEDLAADEPQELAPETGRPLNFNGLSEHRFDWDESFNDSFGRAVDEALAKEEIDDSEDDLVLDSIEETDRDYQAWLASHDLNNL